MESRHESLPEPVLMCVVENFWLFLNDYNNVRDMSLYFKKISMRFTLFKVFRV